MTAAASGSGPLPTPSMPSLPPASAPAWCPPQPTGHPDDPLVYLNGAWLPLSEAKVPVLDRGFIFGDGVYDVVPVYSGRPFRQAEHLGRLRRSMAKIQLADPLQHPANGWEQLVAALIASRANLGPAPDLLVYLHVTRGVARRDHGFPKGVTPTVFAMATPYPAPTAAMRRDGLTAVSMVDTRWLHCDIKAISLLGNVLARQYALDHDAAEVVMFRDGLLTEGSAANIWVVRKGTLLAPQRDTRILEGIRYGLLQQLADAAGVPFAARDITRDEVFSADELLLTSASREVLPITRLDDSPVGAALADDARRGTPGPVYQKLRAEYDRVIQRCRDTD